MRQSVPGNRVLVKNIWVMGKAPYTFTARASSTNLSTEPQEEYHNCRENAKHYDVAASSKGKECCRDTILCEFLAG